MNPVNSAYTVGILLAAGQGRRFRAQMPGQDKLLVRMAENHTVLSKTAATLATATDYAVAVVHPEQQQRLEILRQSGLDTISCINSVAGMGASLAAAADFLSRKKFPVQPIGVVVALADMPEISLNTYFILIKHLHINHIVAPVFNGVRGHPVGFQWQYLPDLCKSSGDTGARSILKANGYAKIPVTDAGVLYDIDLPEHII